ncbi:uncharacterized protein LOC135926816 [Gordionus sp. m RMFG-2023]|uniref:uncharacterized protein LOC135926816 n=1 Tax=Gordionus sp. m RMFG-2023 TaxID=3053472 RepID=UPI0031FCBFD0
MTIEDIYNLGLEEDTADPNGIKGEMKLLHLNESPGVQEVNHMGRVKNSYATTKPIQDSHAHGKYLIKQPQFINDNRPAQNFDERYDLRYDNDRDKRFNGRHSNFHDNRFDQSYDNCHYNRNRFDNRNDNYYDDRYNNSG